MQQCMINCAVWLLCLHPATDRGNLESGSRLHCIHNDLTTNSAHHLTNSDPWTRPPVLGRHAPGRRNLHPLAMAAGLRSDHTPGTLSAQMSHSISSSHFLPSAPERSHFGLVGPLLLCRSRAKC